MCTHLWDNMADWQTGGILLVQEWCGGHFNMMSWNRMSVLDWHTCRRYSTVTLLRQLWTTHGMLSVLEWYECMWIKPPTSISVMYMCQSWNDVVVTSTYIQVSFNISPGPTQYVLMLHTGIYVDVGPGPTRCWLYHSSSVHECVWASFLERWLWCGMYRTGTATPAVGFGGVSPGTIWVCVPVDQTTYFCLCQSWNNVMVTSTYTQV